MCDKCAMHGDEKAEEKPVEYSQSYNTKSGGFTHLFLGEKGKTLLISWGVHRNPLSVSNQISKADAVHLLFYLGEVIPLMVDEVKE